MAAGDGLISMTPTSIAHAGTSASINADGGVDFTAVTSLSLNGVFTSAHDNYLVVIEATGTSQGAVKGRLRASGTDATSTNYAYQYLYVSGTSISAARSTSQNEFYLMEVAAATGNGASLHFYGPALAQPTAERSVDVAAVSGALLPDFANTHSLSSAYDGLTFYPAGGNITGTVHVFGYEE